MVAIMSGAFIAIQTLWAGRWLSDVAGLDRASVADLLLCMAIGFVIGSLTTGGSWIGHSVTASPSNWWSAVRS